MRLVRIPASTNAIIAVITTAATAAAMTLGHTPARSIAPHTATLLGALLITAIGAWTLVASLATLQPAASLPNHRGAGLLRVPRDPDSGDSDGNGAISRSEAIVLGIALALNNVASGVGAGAAGISPLATTMLAGALSLICVASGSRIGRWQPNDSSAAMARRSPA
jgi:putative sporulation protein YtaF